MACVPSSEQKNLPELLHMRVEQTLALVQANMGPKMGPRHYLFGIAQVK